MFNLTFDQMNQVVNGTVLNGVEENVANHFLQNWDEFKADFTQYGFTGIEWADMEFQAGYSDCELDIYVLTQLGKLEPAAKALEKLADILIIRSEKGYPI